MNTNKATFILSLLISLALVSFGQNLSIDGPSEICPNTTHTFTASTSYAGCFSFAVYEDGIWVYSSGSISCSCLPGPSKAQSFTHTFSSSYNVDVKVKVFFKGGLCLETHTKTITINKRMNPPGTPYFSDNSLTICPGETRTVYIEGLDHTEEDCYYHHKYRYTVPTGWSINGGSNSLITFDRQVQITAPISAAYGSNPIVGLAVETEPGQWPYSTESNRIFWVGEPAISNHTISTASNVSASSTQVVNVTAATQALQYQWSIIPSSSCSGGTLPTFSHTGTTSASTSSPQVIVNYGTCSGSFRIRCYATNFCGANDYQDKVVTVAGSGGSCSLSISTSPNPSKGGPSIMKIKDPCDDTIPTIYTVQSGLNIKLFEYQITNHVGEVFFEGISENQTTNFDKMNLPPGLYFIRVHYENKSAYERLIVQ